MSRASRRPVVIAAGGTGGHVVPALAVAAELKSRNVPVVWFGTRTGLEASMVPSNNIEMVWIDVAGLRGKTLLQTLLGPLKLLRAIAQCVKNFWSLKPRAVLGMGGFVSGPAALAALMMRKPLVLHEQNAVAGMTNRYLSASATRVFSAWPNVFRASSNAVVVGNPVNASMEKLAHSDSGVSSDTAQPLRVLVVGGSRGARALNKIVPEAIALMQAAVSVQHQTGQDDFENVREKYKDASEAEVVVTPFIDDMTSAYQQADIVVCRSGAMTVTELGALGLPSILVPFPYAVDDHQTLNAKQLAEAGAAQLMPEATLNTRNLSQILDELALNRQKLALMSKAARSCFVPGAAAAVAHAILEVSR